MISDSIFTKKITGIDYDAESGMLTIQFASKAARHYADVPKKVYDKFAAAANQNEFYQQKIDGQYRLEGK